MAIQCIFIIKTGLTHRYLRRFVYNDKEKCTAPGNYGHDAEVFIDKGLIGEASTTAKIHLDKTDSRWPVKCACGYEFQPDDEWQLRVEEEYAQSNNPNLVYNLNNAPVGAMWYADWYLDYPFGDQYKGPDGHCLTVKTPGGDWIVDSRASNCTKPDDTVHKCWVRQGIPPNITVSKNGNTCSAGAGSIQIGDYHGFLQNGQLT